MVNAQLNTVNVRYPSCSKVACAHKLMGYGYPVVSTGVITLMFYVLNAAAATDCGIVQMCQTSH